MILLDTIRYVSYVWIMLYSSFSVLETWCRVHIISWGMGLLNSRCLTAFFIDPMTQFHLEHHILHQRQNVNFHISPRQHINCVHWLTTFFFWPTLANDLTKIKITQFMSNHYFFSLLTRIEIM